MNRIINSNVILETAIRLDKTFEDLQKLKEMGIADYKSRILHNDGELLPAGAYNDYETFANCYYIMSSVKYGDVESSNNAKEFLMDSLVNMTEEEKLFAIVGWEDFLKKRFEKLNGEINAKKR